MSTKLHAAIYNNYCPMNTLKTLGASGNKQYYSGKFHFNPLKGNDNSKEKLASLLKRIKFLTVKMRA